MIERFSVLAGQTYPAHILRVASPLGQQGMSPVEAIVRSNLAAAQANVAATRQAADRLSGAVAQASHAEVAAINEQTQALAAASQRAASQTEAAIQASTSEISEGLDTVAMTNIFGAVMTTGAIVASTVVLSRGLDRVAVGVDRLGAQFSEGMSLIATQLDAQTDALKDIREQLSAIHETLKSPTMTQAAEWRNMGIQRLAGALWEEAMTAFTKALEYDATDPVAHLMMGKLQLDAVDHDCNLHDPDRAQVSLQKAARYASAAISRAPKLAEIRTEALFLRASALMIQAAAVRLGGAEATTVASLLEAALQAVRQLLDVEPGHRQGQFLQVKLLVLLGREAEAVAAFQQLVQDDHQFLSAALADPDLSRHSEAGRRVIASVEPWLREWIRVEVERFWSAVSEARGWELTIPESLGGWLCREGFGDEVAMSRAFAGWSLTELADPDAPCLTLLAAGSAGLEEMAREAALGAHRELGRLKLDAEGAMARVHRAYVDSSWYADAAWATTDALAEAIAEVTASPATADEADRARSTLRACGELARAVAAKAARCKQAFEEARSTETSAATHLKGSGLALGRVVGWTLVVLVTGLVVAGITAAIFSSTIDDESGGAIGAVVAVSTIVCCLPVGWFIARRRNPPETASPAAQQLSAELAAVGVSKEFRAELLRRLALVR